MTELRLLRAGGLVESVPLGQGVVALPAGGAPQARVAYAAAHVIPFAWGDNVPGEPGQVDWDATLAYRHHIWNLGLGVADAMDTAQRNMGMDWSLTAELIRRTAAEANSVGGRLVVGVNTDHLDSSDVSLDAIVSAYLHQLEVAEDAGAQGVMMASRHLARSAADSSDYVQVYGEVLSRAQKPVVLHWLGDAFDANLLGYFGNDLSSAMQTVEEIIVTNQSQVSGIKMSLLDADAEISLRRRLPGDVRMFTGDDYNYVGLIEGDEEGYSDALLGAFAAFPSVASRALGFIDSGAFDQYKAVLGPTEALSRQIFKAPTQFYKTGVAFMSWLNGHQSAFSMVGGLHSARSLTHLSEVVRLANDSGVFERPEVAAERWHSMLTLNGF